MENLKIGKYSFIKIDNSLIYTCSNICLYKLLFIYLTSFLFILVLSMFYYYFVILMILTSYITIKKALNYRKRLINSLINEINIYFLKFSEFKINVSYEEYNKYLTFKLDKYYQIGDIVIFNRVYSNYYESLFNDNKLLFNTLTNNIDKLCLLTRHSNGYIREYALKNLFEYEEIGDYALIYILLSFSDYVSDILNTLYELLLSNDKVLNKIKDIAKNNKVFIDKLYKTMLNYKYLYYKETNLQDYIGYKIFELLSVNIKGVFIGI